jgi:hypothetical protein
LIFPQTAYPLGVARLGAWHPARLGAWHPS